LNHLTRIPSKSGGGSQFGVSFMKLFKECELKWALQYLYPTGDSGWGLEPKLTSAPLAIGSVVHDGLEAWYGSGVVDGEDTGARNLDVAMAVARKTFQSEYKDRFANGEIALNAWSTCEALLCDYHEHYGPPARDPEYPGIQVAIDDEGSPLLEQELRFPIGHKDFVFTARLDGMVWREGQLLALEHKTTGPRQVKNLFDRFDVDSQASGQLWLLHQAYELEHPIDVVLLNALLKDRSAKSKYPAFIRKDVARTPLDLEKFRMDACRVLARIDAKVEEFFHLLKEGMDAWTAALTVFDGTPSGYTCVGTGIKCQFLDACAWKDAAPRIFESRFQGRVWRSPQEKQFILERS
jgi:hypothetical protein